MAVVTSAVVGVASAGFSIYQSFEQKAKADRRAKEGMEASDKLIKEAEVLAEKKMLQGLQVPLEAFDNEAEQKLQNFFEKIMVLVENTSKSEEDSILLAGAMMSVARILYFDNLSEQEATQIVEHNTRDFISLIKPTIH